MVVPTSAAPSSAAPVADGGYGSDPVLDDLYDKCNSGDNDACDDLYLSSPAGSEYEDFGNTCGGRGLPAGQAVCDSGAELPTASTGGGTYGSDPALDILYDCCEAGNMLSCDELFFKAPLDSEYEEVGLTCGGVGKASDQLWCDPEFDPTQMTG